MKLDPTGGNYDQGWWWVGHPDGGGNDAVSRKLIERRYDIEILGGVEDKDASYSYDDWALCELDREYYLLSTSGCSCPSPSETWVVEIGPATLQQIRDHVTGGHYDGYTVPKKQEDEFLALIDAVININKG